MTTRFSTRRDFSMRLAIFVPVLGIAGTSMASAMAASAVGERISHTAESLHQEVVFKASPKRVYEALTDAKQFDKLVELSGVSMKDAPTQISPEVGGAFSLFAGHIVGRHIELVPNSELSRLGVWSSGIPACTRLRSSSSPSKAQEPKSFSTTPDSPRAWRNISPTGGK